MKFCVKFFFLMISVLLGHTNVFSHGFVGSTVVGLKKSLDVVPIQAISSRFFSGQKTEVSCYKEKSDTWKVKPVQAVAYCQADAFFELTFGKSSTKFCETIKCSPLQLFYRASDQAWIPAYQLREGDRLLCQNNQTVTLQLKKYKDDPIKLYIIEVKKYHTFVVGHQKILTHNMFIPVATTIGMSIPFDMILSAGSFGCMFGPVSFCCSVVAAGAVAAITYQVSKEKQKEFCLVSDDKNGWNLTFEYNDKNKGSADAQAPGLPTENDGFIPKKNWDGKKVKHSKTGQVGWPDSKGSVWVPTGVGPLAHGGPHWDVISKDGKRHWNIMPGGKER